jgi:hypothetical protein
MATRQGAVDGDADPDPQTVAVCCRRTATGRSRRTTKDSSLAQHCWERQQHCWELRPGAAAVDSGGQGRTAVDNTAGNCALAQQARRTAVDPRGWPRNGTRSTTADGQRRGSGRGRRRQARSPANGRRPDLGGGGADLDEGGGGADLGGGGADELAATGSSKRAVAGSGRQRAGSAQMRPQAVGPRRRRRRPRRRRRRPRRRQRGPRRRPEGEMVAGKKI